MLRNRLYYGIKPLLPAGVRLGVRGWLARRKRAQVDTTWPIMPGSERAPEGWPGWPEGKKFALVLTHDVEGQLGLDNSTKLMELEKALGFRSSFTLIPKGEYQVTREILNQFTREGFEVTVHDLYHDGKLFLTRKEFSRNAPEINYYLREWGAVGFRSGFMLHNLNWLHELEIEYDLSTFDTDPFEPQPHGQHTVFPFWVSKPGDGSPESALQHPNSRRCISGTAGYLELPYTLPQDSTLFFLLQEKQPDIWFRKLDWIAQHGGMALLNVHPDYIRFDNKPASRRSYPAEFYRDFLDYARKRYNECFWQPLPREIVAHVKCESTVQQHRTPPVSRRKVMKPEGSSPISNSTEPLIATPLRSRDQPMIAVRSCLGGNTDLQRQGKCLGRITIFGMGYVGCVTAVCLSEGGFEIQGVDLDRNKVELINSGQSPVLEPGLDDAFAKAVHSRSLSAATRAIDLGDVSLVCVGTPSNENGSLDLRQVIRVCEEIGLLLKEREPYHVVDFRSTVLPGTVDGMLIPLLEEKSGKKAGRDFGVCMNPEFLRESTAINDFYNPPFTVIGALDQRSGEAVAKLYSKVPAPLETVPIKVAEMIKYACNSFHALKVSFANEIGSLCKSSGIDSWQVMNIFCRDTKLNLSPYYLRPGFAFGGSCLPKDLRALLHLGRQRDLELPVLSAVLTSNELQIERAYRMIKHTGKSKVGILGLSFKAGSDDLRESPTVALIERLIGKGYSVSIFDDEVSLPDIRGKNRQFIERTLPHIASLMRPSLTEVLEHSEVVTICKKRADFQKALANVNGNRALIDLVRIFGEGAPVPAKYDGICW